MEEQSTEKIRRIIIDSLNQVINDKVYNKNDKEVTANRKPEHMTHLRGDVLVCKDHPRIALRGSLDSLESEIILVQTKVRKMHLSQLYCDLEEIIKTIRNIIRCEVTGEPMEDVCLQGLNADELREHSHHPSRYYGMKHFLPTAEHGEVTGYLNRLRTYTRETEIVAYKAFKTENNETSRTDIQRVLNRLSSLFWIMMFKYVTGIYREEDFITVEASGRHVHLNRGDADALFGMGYQFEKVRELSQPGQYVYKERISVTGPKGTLTNVVVLGPERANTQVEISYTDGLTLGIKPPVRLSGDIQGSPGAILSNGDKQITIESGVIVAQRHMHVSTEDAKLLKIKDKDHLNIEVQGNRPVIFMDTVARVNEKYSTCVHIDYDEANACGFEKGICCRIVP